MKEEGNFSKVKYIIAFPSLVKISEQITSKPLLVEWMVSLVHVATTATNIGVANIFPRRYLA
jgi:hypothetical protein